MNKKIIGVGIITILLLGLGGIFFFSDKLDLVKDESFDYTPTKWSQEEDYKIEETNEGTVVTNKTAGFNFKIPDGWKIEGTEGVGIDEYAINLISPNAEIKKDQYGNFIEFLKGCAIGLETLYQETEVNNVKASIEGIKSDPIPALSANPKKEVISVDNHTAEKTTGEPISEEALQKIGRITQVRLPISNTVIVEFGIRIMPGSEAECSSVLDSFIYNFSID